MKYKCLGCGTTAVLATKYYSFTLEGKLWLDAECPLCNKRMDLEFWLAKVDHKLEHSTTKLK